MRKVILYIAASLDGYIADRNGGVGWLVGDGSDAENPGSYPVFIQTVGTIVLGYRTYHQIVTELSPGEWPYPGKECYVVTHNKCESADGIAFTGESLPDLVRRLKEKDGKDIWICGGANVIDQLMREDIIDDFWISIIPTILGAGVRLFGTIDKAVKLRLLDTRTYNGMVDLRYTRR